MKVFLIVIHYVIYISRFVESIIFDLAEIALFSQKMIGKSFLTVISNQENEQAAISDV